VARLRFDCPATGADRTGELFDDSTELFREESWNIRREIVRADTEGNLHIQTSPPPWALMSIRQM